MISSQASSRSNAGLLSLVVRRRRARGGDRNAHGPDSAPPADPLDGSGDWDAAERDLGTALPADFKELIRLYGTGTFGGVYLANPLQQWGRDMIRDHIAGHQELRDALEFALPLFPERPGFLPWGSDSHGHLYCWWVDGPPDGWTVAQVAHGEEETPHHSPVGITEFLVAYLLNRYQAMLGEGSSQPSIAASSADCRGWGKARRTRRCSRRRGMICF